MDIDQARRAFETACRTGGVRVLRIWSIHNGVAIWAREPGPAAAGEFGIAQQGTSGSEPAAAASGTRRR